MKIDLDLSTTIVALATSPHPAGIGVIRISGSQTFEIIKRLFVSKQDPILNPRMAIFGSVVLNNTKESLGSQTTVLDTGLCIYMPGPNSFTGEDVAELQIHGSPLIASKIIAECLKLGCVPAEPGEFTKRAFLKGKIDLSQAEAISELIHATSENALLIAQEQLNGRLSQAVETIGEPLKDILAELTAGIDFSDEDIEPETINTILPKVELARQQIEGLVATYDYGATVKDGYKVLLCGKPNAGKSSLFNLLLNKKRAIVTEISGTTRDVLEEEFLLEGFKFVLCDSAGVRETEDVVEKIGVELARQRVGWADLVLFVLDVADLANDASQAETPAIQELLVYNEIKKEAKKIYLIVNKIDTIKDSIELNRLENTLKTITNNYFFVSTLTSQQIDLLKKTLVNNVKSKGSNDSDANAIITCERHKNCLNSAIANLNTLKNNFAYNAPIEIIVEDLKAALKSIDEIVGKTFTEDILGRVFSKFCVGK